MTDNELPLSGIRVLEFSHMVMGPTCGLILADLGAEVMKVEPPGGDKTRALPGLGAGFFRTFNRNKQSLILDITTRDGADAARELALQCDVVLENFRPGLMEQLGLGYAALSANHPELIYVSHKGFLPGPYEKRLALDEVVQMMGGLAYMTGLPGRPMRAGTSVNDIMGGMFGAIGVLAALQERVRTGHGQEIQSALFENCAFLSAQHMQQFAVTGDRPQPMSARAAAWGVYDVFTLANDEQLFIAAVSDKQWAALCKLLRASELADDETLRTNAQRVAARPLLLERLGAVLRHHRVDDLEAPLETAGLPYARIIRPDQLFDDPHLRSSGGLGKLKIDEDETTEVPLLPLTMGGRRFNARIALASAGEHTDSVLARFCRRSEK